MGTIHLLSGAKEHVLVLPFINTVTFADGACEARSRREEESMQGHRRRRETKRSPATPIRPKGWDGTGPSSCGFSSPMSLHRLVVAPRSGLRRAPNKRHRIYESEYLAPSPESSGTVPEFWENSWDSPRTLHNPG